MGYRSLRTLASVAALALAACASVPPPASLPARSEIRDFGLEARFALRLERPHEAPQSASGRLSWQHAGQTDRILLSSPLGQGVAEIESSAAGARLRTSDGRIREAADPAALAEEATGYPLPLGELSGWLTGRPGVSGRLQTDSLGRPRHLADGSWRIEYDYDSEAADALPARLVLRRDDSLELRLRIEEWRTQP